MWLLFFFACATSSPVETPQPRHQRSQSPAHNDEKPKEGRWNRARSSSVSDDIAALEAIGYVGGAEVGSGKAGVTVHKKSAQEGLNFYVTGSDASATLMDMDGRELHTWSKAFREIWPHKRVKKGARGVDFWRRAYLFPNGDVIGIYEGQGLVRINKDSVVLWSWEGRAHHDIAVNEDGSFWVLAREAHVVDGLHKTKPVLEDFVVLLSPDGKERQKISVLEAVRSSAPEAMKRIPKRSGDIFHTNSVEVLDDTAKAKNPAFHAGSLLLSMRALSTIMVLDPRTGKITWWHHGNYSKQHDPKVLPNGNLLVFDNIGAGDGFSAVREYDLSTMREVWTYSQPERDAFFSRFCGTAERLQNGNTLVVESGVGHVMEVTPSGELVWEFNNPRRAGDNNEFVAIVPDLVRLPPGYVRFLDSRKQETKSQSKPL